MCHSTQCHSHTILLALGEGPLSGSIIDVPYSISRKNSSEPIELSSINKVSLV